MGACFSDCYYAYFASDYETIPEEVSEWNKMPTSPASSTGFGYQSDGTVPSNRSSDNALPHSFLSSYIMGELIGVGTTAEVFRVAYKQADGSPDHQRPLVCKVIDKRGITYSIEENDPSPALQQLWREVEILKRIRHPNIVAYYDYMETKDRLYIITERLEGGELFDYISNNGPLTEDLACQILYGVFSAVAYLHERGVVHRDIKAENLIFFRDSYNQVSLKLIDFGFSTIVDRQAAGTFLGTGGYIAPEIRQNKDYTTSVDMWSLGVLLYCSLSARLPFGISLDTLPDEIDACRQTFDLQFPQKLFGRVSAPCIRLITQLLEVDPARRLSASEALHHPWFAAQHELARSRPPLPSATQRFSPQHRQPPQPQHYAGSYQSSSESSLEGPSYFHSYQQDTGNNQHTSLTAGAPSERTPLVQSSANITPKARHDLALQQDPSQRGAAVSHPAKDTVVAVRPTQVARDQSGLCDYRHHSGFLAME